MAEYNDRGSSEEEALERIWYLLEEMAQHYVGDIGDGATLLAAASDFEMCVGEATDFVSGWSVETRLGNGSLLVRVTHKAGAVVQCLIGDREPPADAISCVDFLAGF